MFLMMGAAGGQDAPEPPMVNYVDVNQGGDNSTGDPIVIKAPSNWTDSMDEDKARKLYLEIEARSFNIGEGGGQAATGDDRIVNGFFPRDGWFPMVARIAFVYANDASRL